MNRHSEILDETARCVAFVARHCGVPIHLACIRRLCPEVFTAAVARQCLLKAAQYVLLQQRALKAAQQPSKPSSGERAVIVSSGDESPVKMNQLQARQQQPQHSIACFGFFQVLVSETNSSAFRTQLAEIPLESTAIANASSSSRGAAVAAAAAPREVIDLLTLPPLQGGSGALLLHSSQQHAEEEDGCSAASSSSSIVVILSGGSEQQKRAAPVHGTMSIGSLVTLWVADRAVASSLDAVAVAGSGDRSERPSANCVLNSLLSGAWQTDFKALLLRCGLFDTARSLSLLAKEQRGPLNVVTSVVTSALTQRPGAIDEAKSSSGGGGALLTRKDSLVEHITITRKVSASTAATAAGATTNIPSSVAVSYLSSHSGNLPWAASFPRDSSRFLPELTPSAAAAAADSILPQQQQRQPEFKHRNDCVASDKFSLPRRRQRQL